MEGKRVLKSLRLRNTLSFGGEAPEVELGPLNVLIGPNGSGKSNVLEALNLLHCLPRDIAAAVQESGGIDGWIRKGTRRILAEIDTAWEYEPGQFPLRHMIYLLSEGYRIKVALEVISQSGIRDGTGIHDEHYRYSPAAAPGHQGPAYYDFADHVKVAVDSGAFQDDVSILAQRWDPKRSPGLAFLEDRFKQILLYRDWITGPKAPIRSPQSASLPGDFLREDYTNLGLILHGLMNDRETRRTILDALGRLYEGATDIRIKIVSGFVELNVEEEEGRLIPASRLSDGTLRFLCLLAILCHPGPPPLIGIEEPELGLHPDVIRTVAGLLIAASERTQLIVTTHSESLVSALSETPEAVIVCEKRGDSSELRRLDPERLEKWLEDYSLGELWLNGEIGGTRW